jgi:hypothetical protein
MHPGPTVANCSSCCASLIAMASPQSWAGYGPACRRASLDVPVLADLLAAGVTAERFAWLARRQYCGPLSLRDGGDSMTDWEGRVKHMYGAIARDRSLIFGDLTNEEYAEAWARRLLEIIPEAPPEDEYHSRVQSARRAAVLLLQGPDASVNPDDRRNFDELVAAFPRIEGGDELGPDRALELLTWRTARLRGEPPTPEEAGSTGQKQRRAGCLTSLLLLLGAAGLLVALPLVRVH